MDLIKNQLFTIIFGSFLTIGTGYIGYALTAGVENVRTDMRFQISQVRQDMKDQFTQLRSDMKDQNTVLRDDLREIRNLEIQILQRDPSGSHSGQPKGQVAPRR